jgi:hypothetical protein
MRFNAVQQNYLSAGKNRWTIRPKRWSIVSVAGVTNVFTYRSGVITDPAKLNRLTYEEWFSHLFKPADFSLLTRIPSAVAGVRSSFSLPLKD